MNTLPIDWNQWRGQWNDWKRAHKSQLKSCAKFAPGKNLMADEILGSWEINGRKVELSEVTMPDFSSAKYFGGDKRYIGVTYENESGPLVESFEELNRELGL